MKNSDLATDFAQGKKKGTGSHMFIEGDTIYSYGHHFPIATITSDRTALFNEDRYSPTTSRHKAYVKRSLLAAGFTLEKTNTTNLRNESFVRDNKRKKMRRL